MTYIYLYALPLIHTGSHEFITVSNVIQVLSLFIHHFQIAAPAGSVVYRITRWQPAAVTQLTTPPTVVTFLKVDEDERK